MKSRSIPVCILLSLVTCGIYPIYWFIVMTDDANYVSGDQNATSGGMAFLLGIITCSIYTYYWAYKQGEKIVRAKQMRGIPADSNLPILYLILSLPIIPCGPIIGYCLMQNELNKFC